MLETPDGSTRERAISLRAADLSYAEIGRRLGVSTQRVWAILNPKRSKRAQDKVAPATIAMMQFSGGMMLTPRDVSQLLGVHPNTVRRWSNKAILKCYRIGPRGDRRFLRKDIDAFVKEAREDE